MQEIAVAKVHGGHVSWVLVGVIELIYWNVWAAFTPLVIALAKRFPLTGVGWPVYGPRLSQGSNLRLADHARK